MKQIKGETFEPIISNVNIPMGEIEGPIWMWLHSDIVCKINKRNKLYVGFMSLDRIIDLHGYMIHMHPHLDLIRELFIVHKDYYDTGVVGIKAITIDLRELTITQYISKLEELLDRMWIV